MKVLIYIFILFNISCNITNNKEIRKPFELNHRLTTDILIDNNYERIWGVDVELFGKEINGINVYYQIDLPPIKTDANNSKRDYLKAIRELGVISFKNYQEIITIDKYHELKSELLPSIYKVLKNDFDKGNYYIDKFNVVNLKTLDTFHCSLTKDEDNNLLFESHISIK
jgi:hypothetical protein